MCQQARSDLLGERTIVSRIVRPGCDTLAQRHCGLVHRRVMDLDTSIGISEVNTGEAPEIPGRRCIVSRES